MGLKLEYHDGQTPLDEAEKEGLRIASVTTHEELDELEQLNMEKALVWIIQSNFKPKNVLTEKFLKTVHRRMFGDVWKWAGEFRRTDKNIGTKWPQIGTELKQLLDDTTYWIEHETFPPDEIAIRFKHRLVSIHCFANGNGRHSRLMADILAETVFGNEVFSWSASRMGKPDDVRKSYIAALHKADNGNIRPLILFART
ncbi:MAG: mobile mystery protein B [Flavobacteriales bacterium]|nr:mobile mystery protein B [Flavobacteriales bacterium]